MVIERGPRGKIHVPGYREGCYRGRITDCCFLCLFHIFFSAAKTPIKYRIRNAWSDYDHELVEESVVVPYVTQTSESHDIDYKTGKVEEVYVLSDTEPIILTVKIDEDERVLVDFSSDEEVLRPDERDQMVDA